MPMCGVPKSLDNVEFLVALNEADNVEEEVEKAKGDVVAVVVAAVMEEVTVVLRM